MRKTYQMFLALVAMMLLGAMNVYDAAGCNECKCRRNILEGCSFLAA